MTAFGRVVCPDRRMLGRLVQILRSRDEHPAYSVAGEALANAILASSPGELPVEAEQLADAMLGSLLRVTAETADAEDADRRVRLAMATAVVAAARPHAALACHQAIGTWMGTGIGSPLRQRHTYALAARVLLSLWLNDRDAAAEATNALVEFDRTGLSGVLHDWVVARLQGHGAEREAQCFEALRLSMAFAPGGGDGAALVVLAAAVVVRRQGNTMRGVRSFIDDASMPKRTPVPERRVVVH
jgi:hypothetical protein